MKLAVLFTGMAMGVMPWGVVTKPLGVTAQLIGLGVQLVGLALIVSSFFIKETI